MEISWILKTESWQLALMLFFLMLLFVLSGFYIGKKKQREGEKEATALGSLFALLGLLLAFTFSMAVNRYDTRRQIVVEESNDIGTAVLRSDLYNEADRAAFRSDFKNYVETRINYFEAGADVVKIIQAKNESADISQKIWDRAARLSKEPNNYLASMQMIPALNSMIDITNTRWYSELARVPETVIYLLFILACACSFYLGLSFGEKTRIDWMSAIGFCLFTSIVVMIIFDIDRPRRGFITLKQTNQSIVDLRSMFDE